MSKTDLTQEQFDRLPKYAQRHIRELERRTEIAARIVDRMQEEQPRTNISTSELDNIDGKQVYRERFFQANHLTIQQNGVRLTIEGLWKDDQDIRLSWGPSGSMSGLGTIAFVPTAHQQAKLVNIVYDEHELKRLLTHREKNDERKEACADQASA